jgi:hypothetical protein
MQDEKKDNLTASSGSPRHDADNPTCINLVINILQV